MSVWFKDRRQEFIAATLRQFGQVRRADIMREFDVSAVQASNDIAVFLSTKPPLVRYDVSAKCYVLGGTPQVTPPDPREIAAGLTKDDPWLVSYLLGWAGLGPAESWGAAMSFAIETAHSKGLIVSEMDAALTPLGQQVAAILKEQNDG